MSQATFAGRVLCSSLPSPGQRLPGSAHPVSGAGSLESAVWWVPPAGLRRHLPLQLRLLLLRHLVAAEASHLEAKPRFSQRVGTGRVLRLELRPLPNLRRRAQGRERLNGAMRQCCLVAIGRALCRAPPLVAKLGGSCGPASCRGHSCAGSQQGSSGGSSSRGLKLTAALLHFKFVEQQLDFLNCSNQWPSRCVRPALSTSYTGLESTVRMLKSHLGQHFSRGFRH